MESALRLSAVEFSMLLTKPLTSTAAIFFSSCFSCRVFLSEASASCVDCAWLWSCALCGVAVALAVAVAAKAAEPMPKHAVAMAIARMLRSNVFMGSPLQDVSSPPTMRLGGWLAASMAQRMSGRIIVTLFRVQSRPAYVFITRH